MPGAVVPLYITFWPMSMVFAEGEGIKLFIAGHDLSEPAVATMKLQAPDDENMGQHHVHTGGQYDSHLILPIVARSRGRALVCSKSSTRAHGCSFLL